MRAAQDIDRPWRRRFLGIVLCAIAAGPIVCLLVMLSGLMETYSLASWIEELSRWNLTTALRRVILVQVGSLPALLVFALILWWLRKLNADSLLVAVVIAAPTGFFAVFFAIALKIKRLPHINSADDVHVAIWVLVPGAILGVLYWFLVVRVERRLADARMRNAAAIQAME